MLFPKPARGAALLERKERRLGQVKAEDAEKEKCRRRDRRRCRYPHCPYCAKHKDLKPQAAHVLQAKGMSGDKTGERSTRDKLMLLCPPIHGLQEKHDVVIHPTTDKGTDGPCEFWRLGQNGKLYMVAREVRPFEYEKT